MSLSYIAGFTVGILIVLAVFLIARKKLVGCSKYDERQKAIQGVAYKVGFFAMFAYFIINGFICMELGNWMPVFEMNFIGIGVGVVCYAGYAIFKDAYISLNTKPLRFLLFMAFVAVINYISFFANSGINSDIPEVYLTNLVCGILLTAVCVMLIIKIIIDKVNAKKELVEE